MAYIGTPPASKALTSADIAQGAVTLDDISFTDQPANLNISGNIDKHTMRLTDGVTVTGDMNITDDLVLSKLSDDGNAITLTDDGTSRTIEGAGGTILASTISSTPNASLTGMTGTVGSGVTIGSAVTNNAGAASGTIGSGVTFPTGHVVQVVQHVIRDTFETSSTSFVATDTTGAITPLSTSNKVLVMISSVIDTGANERTPQLMLYRNGVAVSNASEGLLQAKSGAGGHIRVPFTINWLDSPSSTSAVTYTLYAKDSGSGGTIAVPPYASMDHTLTLMEITG